MTALNPGPASLERQHYPKCPSQGPCRHRKPGDAPWMFPDFHRSVVNENPLKFLAQPVNKSQCGYLSQSSRPSFC